MVGGVLFLAFPPFVALMGFPSYVPVVAVVVALLLVPVGMVGLHLLQKRSYGRIGRAGL